MNMKKLKAFPIELYSETYPKLYTNTVSFNQTNLKKVANQILTMYSYLIRHNL